MSWHKPGAGNVYQSGAGDRFLDNPTSFRAARKVSGVSKRCGSIAILEWPFTAHCRRSPPG
jgi:hypothetical protein